MTGDFSKNTGGAGNQITDCLISSQQSSGQAADLYHSADLRVTCAAHEGAGENLHDCVCMQGETTNFQRVKLVSNKTFSKLDSAVNVLTLKANLRVFIDSDG